MRRIAEKNDSGALRGRVALNLAGMCEPLVARISAASSPMVCAVAVPPVPGRACWACSITTLLVLENWGVFRKSESVSWSGWSKRTGGRAWWSGGGQQAAMKNTPSTRDEAAAALPDSFVHGLTLVSFTQGQAEFEDGSGAGL